MNSAPMADPGRFKISKRAAHYQDVPKNGLSCKVCFRYRDHECLAVHGYMSGDGYCHNFRLPNIQQWVNELAEKARRP